MAYGLYEQIKADKELGINKLKTFMKTNIPKKEKSDFSFIDLSDYLLLKYIQEISGKHTLIKNNRNMK